MAKKTICIVTGSRAEFGLLRPVMRAVAAHKSLRLQVIIAGSHLLPPGTGKEVEAEFGKHVADVVPMQGQASPRTRQLDALDTAEGMSGFASAFGHIRPEWVVVLGDRIEAFAAAAAASIGGYGLCHIHGGDRAEGVADEAMRHAISKLAHLHCAATASSAARLVKMGEPKARVHTVGSPAIDGLAEMAKANGPLGWERDGGAESMPDIVLLQHPAGLGERVERAWARAAVAACDRAAQRGVLALEPNYDAGREAISAVLADKMAQPAAKARTPWVLAEHLPRGAFVGTLAGLAASGGVLVGNSSAGLIEAAALGTAVVNLGPRQAGRECAGNVVDVAKADAGAIAAAIAAVRRRKLRPAKLYGDGHAGERIAALLAKTDGCAALCLRKCNAY